MKTTLILSLLFVCLLCGSTVVAQTDPNEADTVVMSLQVNGDTSKATLEIYVYSDEQLTGATVGFSWDNPNFQMDSAKATTVIDSVFDLITLFYESDSLELTNENQRFLFGGARGSSPGLDGDAGGLRLWVTYYFSITSWNGLANDGVTFDTLEWDWGSEYMFVSQSHPDSPQVRFQPIWSDAFIFGNPQVGVSVREPGLPQKFTLGQNYPNPFNPTTKIAFDLPRRSHVTLKVFNILGQLVATLIDCEMSAGNYVADWDGTTVDGTIVSTGVYLYRLRAGDFEQSRKMLLLK